MVRWFQYGTFCPLFRLYEYRQLYSNPDSASITGGVNEVWSFGEEAYAIIRDLLFVRERLSPYINKQMWIAQQNGTPPMRLLFFDFPENPECTPVDDQFIFDLDILVAPVLHEAALRRNVYLPHGLKWIDARTDCKLKRGQCIRMNAVLERILLYVRKGADLPIRLA